ncbi:hypothetical protein LINPERPRIM_LOCUS7098, partial [Linum perenne]
IVGLSGQDLKLRTVPLLLVITQPPITGSWPTSSFPLYATFTFSSHALLALDFYKLTASIAWIGYGRHFKGLSLFPLYGDLGRRFEQNDGRLEHVVLCVNVTCDELFHFDPQAKGD